MAPTHSESNYPRSLLTVADVARLTRLSANQVRNLVRQGRLPAVDFGSGRRHCWRFDPDTVASLFRTDGRVAEGR